MTTATDGTRQRQMWRSFMLALGRNMPRPATQSKPLAQRPQG
jgi:hypothetical protein